MSLVFRVWLLVCLLVPCAARAQFLFSPQSLAVLYAQSVVPRLEPPVDVQQRYAQSALDALRAAGLVDLPAQYLLLVDRNPHVQALLLYWLPLGALPELMGASPVSTGRPGRFDYFETPLGVFDHTVANLDFRAEGTLNEFGIRGYGAKGMRVFDFGWQQAPRGWGKRQTSTMRLQLHATDPKFLEPRLGTAQSKGCVRIPASLNRLIDHYGLLDADYERGMRDGSRFWMLDPNRQPTPWSGRYLIVVDSGSTESPPWARLGAGGR